MATSLGDLPELDKQVLILLDEGNTEDQIALQLQVSAWDVGDAIHWLRLMLLLPSDTPAQYLIKCAQEKGSLID